MKEESRAKALTLKKTKKIQNTKYKFFLNERG